MTNEYNGMTTRLGFQLIRLVFVVVNDYIYDLWNTYCMVEKWKKVPKIQFED